MKLMAELVGKWKINMSELYDLWVYSLSIILYSCAVYVTAMTGITNT
jgi:hypothetical protein